MILVRFWTVRACLAMLLWVSAVLEVSAQVPDAPGSLPKNEAGVLTLQLYPGIDAETFDGDCSVLTLADAAGVQVQAPGDGTLQLIAVHMSFPADQPIAVAGTTFGLDLSDSIEITRFGFCKANNDIVLSDGLWPRTDSNVGLYFGPARTENHAVIAWFIVSCDGEGWLAAVPHADGGSGAVFANLEPAPHLEAITGFGRIGFGNTRGVVPTVGLRLSRGVCCISEACATVSQLACDHYGGLYLGEETDCESGPCAPDAGEGACCLPDGCSLLTRRGCFVEAGQFLGEGTTCDEADCAGIWVDGGDE